MKFKNLIKYSKWIWSAAVLAAVVYYLIKNWTVVSGYFVTIPPLNLILTVLFLAAGKLVLVILSKSALISEGLTLPYAQMFRIVSLSQLGKYIPGGVWHFVGRYNMYHDQDLSIKKSTKALIIENFWLLTGAVISGLVFACFSPHTPELLNKLGLTFPSWAFPVIAFGLILIWLLILIVFDLMFRMKGRKIKLGALLYLMGVQVLTWVFLGLSFALVFPQVQLDTLTMKIGFFALSWIIGYVAIFAPGGIGIREGALIWMFASFYTSQEILVIATVHRFIYFIVEVLLGLVAWKIKSRIPDEQEIQPNN